MKVISDCDLLKCISILIFGFFTSVCDLNLVRVNLNSLVRLIIQ